MFSKFRSQLGTLWCIHSHDSVMWPAHGEFQCRTCGRRYVAFAEPPVANPMSGAASRVAASAWQFER